MRKLRALVADDHPLFLFAMAYAVSSRQEFDLVAQVSTGRDAIAKAQETAPDLAVLDFEMPDLSGLEVMRAFTREGLPTRVLFVSGKLDSEVAYELIEAGAAGLLDKGANPEEIGDALMRISTGETVLIAAGQAALMRGVRDRRDQPKTVLTPREGEVLRAISNGMSAPQIAKQLHLSSSTVKTHLHRLYERLDVSDRAAAVAEGIRRGLIE